MNDPTQKKVKNNLWPYLFIASMTAITVTITTGAWLIFRGEPESISEPPQIVEYLEEQLDAVRVGASDTIELRKTLVTDEELAKFRDLDGLTVLILDEGLITDAGLKEIATLPNLTRLQLRHSPITDAGIEEIVNLKELRFINLPQANLTPVGIGLLHNFEKLRQLRLGGDNITDLSDSISSLTGLRSLHLINIPISDSGLKKLAAMPALESLYLDNAKISDEGWEWVFDNHPELHIHINQRHHDRDPKRHAH